MKWHEWKNGGYNISVINHNRVSERIAGNKATNKDNWVHTVMVYTRHRIEQREKEKYFITITNVTELRHKIATYLLKLTIQIDGNTDFQQYDY